MVRRTRSNQSSRWSTSTTCKRLDNILQVGGHDIIDGHQRCAKTKQDYQTVFSQTTEGHWPVTRQCLPPPTSPQSLHTAPPQLPKSDVEQRPVARGLPAPSGPQPRVRRAFRPLVVASEASSSRSQQFPKPRVHNGTKASARPRPAGGKTLCARISAAAGAAHSPAKRFSSDALRARQRARRRARRHFHRWRQLVRRRRCRGAVSRHGEHCVRRRRLASDGRLRHLLLTPAAAQNTGFMVPTRCSSLVVRDI